MKLPPNIVHDLFVKFGCDPLLNKVGPLRYVYSPEFLREATWELDAVNMNFMILAGNYQDCKELEKIYVYHSSIPPYCKFHYADYREASLAKYAINTFLATKVSFMNQIYQLYVDTYELDHPPLPETWKFFTNILSDDKRFGGSHMQVPGPDGNYGYGGSCFPKDVKALIGFDKHERLSILREVELANTKIRLQGFVDSPPDVV